MGEIRRAELAKALSPTLLKAIPAAASELAATSFGLQFLTEVLLAAGGDKAAAETAAGDPTYIQPVVAEGETSTEPPSHVAITSHGGKMIKSLIAGGRFDPKTKAIIPIEPALNFADILYPNIKDYIIEWATGSSSFVVLALLESPTFSQKEEVLKVLKKNKTKLQKAATEETADQKARRELAAIEKDSKDVKGKTKKSKPVKEREVGNKGSALLLAMI